MTYVDGIDYKDSELLIVTTGSQGEPMSALTRMASGDFQKIKLDENDCIIFSSSPIPGNEKSVNNVINNLCKLGCTIIYDQLAEVHASGHAYREELKLIHYLLKPKFFMPVHMDIASPTLLSISTSAKSLLSCATAAAYSSGVFVPLTTPNATFK